jgi:hypothetical protein
MHEHEHNTDTQDADHTRTNENEPADQQQQLAAGYTDFDGQARSLASTHSTPPGY